MPPEPVTDGPTLRHQYPVNLELEGRRVLLVGGGRVACQKIRSMLTAGACVTVVAPEIDDQIVADAADERLVHLHRRRYRSDDIEGHQLVLTCTDDREVNRQVFADSEAAGVWCNSADDPNNCSWTLPSVVRQGDLQIAISTRGKSPALSMYLRRRFEQEFDARWADLLVLLADVRTELRAERGTSEVSGWQEALGAIDPSPIKPSAIDPSGIDEGANRPGAIDLVLAGDLSGARQHLRSQLGLATGQVTDVSEEVAA